jgi:hypothetical protein
MRQILRKIKLHDSFDLHALDGPIYTSSASELVCRSDIPHSQSGATPDG